GPGEIWLPDQGRLVLLDRYRRVAGGVEVDAGGLRVFLEVGEVPGDGEGRVPGHREAVFREGDGRFEHLAQRHRAVALQGEGEAGNSARNSDGAVADDVGVINGGRPPEEEGVSGAGFGEGVHIRRRGRG